MMILPNASFLWLMLLGILAEMYMLFLACRRFMAEPGLLDLDPCIDRFEQQLETDLTKPSSHILVFSCLGFLRYLLIGAAWGVVVIFLASRWIDRVTVSWIALGGSSALLLIWMLLSIWIERQAWSLLIVTGPFRYARYPDESANILYLAGMTLLLRSGLLGLLTVAYVICAAALAARMDVFRLKFLGQAFEEYVKSTWRLMPGVY